MTNLAKRNELPQIIFETQEIIPFGKGKVSDSLFERFKALVKGIYGNVNDAFFMVIRNRIDREEWSEERFIKAMNKFLEEGDVYGLPKPKDFFNNEIKVKYYTYEEAMQRVTPYTTSTDLFDMVDIGLKYAVFVEKGMAKKHGLKIWDYKEKIREKRKNNPPRGIVKEVESVAKRLGVR